MTTLPNQTSPCFAARDDAGALLFAEADSGGYGGQGTAAVGGPAWGSDPRLGPAAATNPTPIGASA